MKVTLVNDLMLEFWGKGNNVEGKTFLEILPELSNQPFPAMIDSVYTTGVAVYANEILAHLNRNGIMEDKYFNIVYEPHFEADNTISGVITIAHEVTQQVLARKNMEESETLFKLALFLTAKTVFKQDTQLRYTWIYNTHTSLEMKDLVGKKDIDLFSNDAAGILTTIKQTVLNTGNTFNGDIQIEIDGKLFDFAMMVEATKDIAGKINGIIAVSDDITEKKKAENKIKESEQEIRKIKEQLELSIRAGKIGIWHWDIKNDILYWSKEQKAIYGLEQSAELLNVAQFKALVNPEDWERLNKNLQSAPLTEEQEYDFKIIRKNDGEIRWIKSRAKNILDPQGALQFISGVNIDITEQVLALNKIQESEERFRSLAQSLPQLVWVTDAKGTLEFASNRWKEYSGVLPNGEKEWKAIVHPDDYDNINAAWIHSLSTGAIYYYDVRLKNKNGEYKWHTAMGEPVVDNKNNIVKWVGAFINTHAEKLFTQELELKVKQRTSELEQFNIELEQKNKQLQSFSYVASHDLQEPLRKIQSFAVRIIEDEYNTLSKNGKDYFKRMQDAAYRMQTLIQDLLTYSSTNIAVGKLELTSLNKIIDQVKEDLSEALKEKQVTIEATELCNVKIIPFQLYQLMHNLLGNAVKFSLPNTPVHIIIKSVIASGVELQNKKLKPQLNYCHISITDNGIGFEQEYSEKIFEVFQRLHGKEEYAGTGIGLSIVKKIVDNHAGIVTATSQLNKGATFNIYIPI